MDCVISYGFHLGRLIPLIKKNPNYSNCKWIQVVHSAPEKDGMYKNISEEVEQAIEERRTFSILVCESRESCEDFICKGYDIAAEAIAMLKDQSYKLKVVCPARGKENILEEKFLHHGIRRSQLIVCGFYDSREALADLFCGVDLAIMPSRTESFGITALGALSAGLPVLVSGNSGLGEAMKKVLLGSQSVVDSEDPKDWAKEIKRVCQKERELQLEESRYLQEKYLERYSWKELCKSLVIRMRNLAFGESVIRHLQQWQQNVSRCKISSNADPLANLRKSKHLVLGRVHELHYVSPQPLQVASGSTEVKQEKKSGSAAKNCKLDHTGEPGTSGVSSTSKTRKFEGASELNLVKERLARIIQGKVTY
ncbi:mannosylfructose-phosphate synthase-like [Pocillopora verrucosa]|uniref:mannosylfructose-phosphate synthase-like n=1 Tax=Pocillopora verrucosa TaxID=203993 RepID=UPI00333F3971